MALVIEGVDLAALAAILMLIGLLIAVGYTFTKLADVLDVGILGVHPFHGIATGIRNSIVAGCNAGIKALGSVAHDLWVGAKWSFNEMAQAIMSIPNGVHAALNFMWNDATPTFVKASLGAVHTQINALSAQLENWSSELAGDVVRLDARIDSTATATLHTAEAEISNTLHGLQSQLANGLSALRSTLLQEIGASTSAAESVAASALSKVEAAENAAVDALGRAEGATADQLRDYINSVPLTDIEAAMAAIPLISAAVNVLEAETGLGRAECRAKVKGICGVDPASWANLLEGLALLAAGISLSDVFALAEEAAKTALPVVEALVREAA